MRSCLVTLVDAKQIQIKTARKSISEAVITVYCNINLLTTIMCHVVLVTNHQNSQILTRLVRFSPF